MKMCHSPTLHSKTGPAREGLVFRSGAVPSIHGARVISIPLSDDDWSRVAHLFMEDEVPRFGRPRRPAREVLDAVLWITLNGEKWHRLPPTFPPARTCYIKYLRWKKWGVLCEAFSELGVNCRSRLPGLSDHGT